ncbi:MAG: DUF4347 domain-containing protein [Nitrosomonas sp.]|nr:DUF4347 domain-containing protein [Nitrosomonas sp.]
MFLTSQSKCNERKLLFVDAGVLESNRLLENLHPDFHVVQLLAETNPILQITRSLSVFAPVNEIALLVHAQPGQIDFTNYPIDRAALENYKDELYSWRNLITDDARICVYACSLAKGNIGQSFIHTLARLTHADVASSTLPIGKLGAQTNWNLDSYTKPFQCLFPFDVNSVAAYPHVLAPIFTGTEGDDTISGSNEADTINGLTGNDVLIGEGGFDVYVFDQGFGQDTINEQWWGLHGGVIRFGEGIIPEDLRFIRPVDNFEDLIIKAGGDSIRIRLFYNSSNYSSSEPFGRISSLEFTSGESISLLEPLTYIGTNQNDDIYGTGLADTINGLAGDDRLLGGYGLDIYEFEQGFGQDTIFERGSGEDGGVIRFGDDIAPENLRFIRTSKASGDLIIEANSDSIRINSFYNTASYEDLPSGFISRIEFANAEPINLLEPLAFIGTEQNDTIYGSGLADTINGLTGNDKLMGNKGYDIYEFGSNFGHDTIDESFFGENGGVIDGGMIRFTEGITPEELRFVIDPSSSFYHLNILAGTNSIRIDGFYDSVNSDIFPSGNISRIEFADGKFINLLESLEFAGTVQNDTIYGSGLGDTINGMAGDDVLRGRGGLDVYKFEPGFGQDTIIETGSGDEGGVIRFGEGITAEDLRFSRASNDRRDLIIEANTDSIRIPSFFNTTSSSASPTGIISQIEFANAESINLLEPLTFTGTDQSDLIYGTVQSDTIIGLAGDDHMSGGRGSNIYYFELGFGQDRIFHEDYPFHDDNSIIRFGEGIVPDDLGFFRAANDLRALIIEVGADSIRVDSFFSSTSIAASSTGVIGQIEFANGQQIDLNLLEVDETGALTNHPPNAQNDSVDTEVGTPVEINLLQNDSDPDGDPFAITAVGDMAFTPDIPILLPSGATVSISAAGIASYTPDPNLADTLLTGQSASDSFNYQIGDGRGGFDFATVTVNIDTPAPIELDLTIQDGLAPGEVGIAEVTYLNSGLGEEAPSTTTTNDPLTVISSNSISTTIEAPNAVLISVAAKGGLIADPLTGTFSDRVFVLGTGGDDGILSRGESGSIALNVKGSAGPRSTLSVEAQVADHFAVTEIGARYEALQPTYLSAGVINKLSDNVVLRLGDTVATFTSALAEHGVKLASFGLEARSATSALAFAIDSAGDFGSIAERGQTGSLGKGWSTIADIGLDIDGGSVRMRGLTEIDALMSPTIDSAALYTVSASVGRTMTLGGNLLAFDAAARPAFERKIDGSFSTIGAFDGALHKTTSGYTAIKSDGDRLEFDVNGGFLGMIAADGRQVLASHDSAGRITGLSAPNGNALSFTRDSQGLVTQIIDADGSTAALSYSANGELAAVTRSQGQSQFSYDAAGDLVGAIAPGNIATHLAYDGAGRLQQVSLAGGLQTESYSYDATGGVTITDGAGRTAELNLLPGGIAGRLADGDGNTSELVYNESGDLLGVRAPDGTFTAFEFDSQNRLTKITDANGAQLSFTYDQTGEAPIAFTDAGGGTRNFTYDAGGRITEAVWPDGTQLAFDYDAEGNLTSFTNRRGDNVDYTYDARGRLLSESDSSAGPTSYVYDDRGRLISATNDQGTTSLAYDSADRMTEINYLTGKSLFYTYNDAGLRTSISDGGDYNVFYDYDALGRLTGLRDEDSQIVSYAYDGAGNLVREENGNGTVSIFSYDNAGRLTRIENQAPDGGINSFNAYTYDAAGQRVTNETQDGAWSYGYDAIGQLTAANFVSTNAAIPNKTLVYEYDAAGNRTRVVEDGVETLYTANALNQYTQVGGATFTYDDDGNMTSRTDSTGTTTYTYDLDNRLTAVTEADGTVLTFEYDLFGNRVAKTVDGVETEYLVDPFGLGDVVSEFTGGSLSASYTHGLGLAAGEIGGQDAYYDADAVGTVTTLTGASGDIQNHYVFTPFGTELFEVESLANSFEFNGVLGVAEDSDGLTFMRARHYSDNLGRFQSEDPKWLNGDPENMYRFALNSPNEYVDPNGDWWAVAAAIVAFGAFTYDAIQKAKDREDRRSNYNLSDSITDEELEAYQRDYGQNLKDGADTLVDGILVNKVVAAARSGASVIGGTLKKLAEAADAIDQALENGELVKQALEDATEDKPTSNPVSDASPVEQPPLGGGSVSPEAIPRPRTGGDPHIQTFDGLGYSFQTVGEFIMFRGQNDEFEFQVRQSPLPGNNLVSVNSAVATVINGNTVGVYADRIIPLVINGEAVELKNGESIAVGNGSVYRNGNTYVVTNEFGDGVVAAVRRGFTDFLTIQNFLAPERGAGVEGLFGNADGIRENDLALRDGTVLTQPVAATDLYGVFADNWRITNEESFFDYLEGESTETFTDLSFPREIVTLNDLDPVVRAAAEQIARDAGLVPGTFEFETTVLDVALSGDPAFAEATQDIPAFDPDFNPETDFGLIVPVEVNEAPIANPDNASVDEDGTVDIDVLANDEDPEGDTLVILGAGDVNGGTVEVVNDLLRFTPAQGFSGETVISYQLGDGMGNAVLGTVLVEVGPVPDAPVAGDDTYVVQAGNTLNIDAVSGLLANDTDDDGDLLQVVSVSDPANGILNVSADGSFTYTPDAGFFGTENLVYSVSDGLTTVDGQLVINVEGTIEPVIVSIGDAPLRVSRSDPNAWENAWTDEAVSISHKADYLDTTETWSGAAFHGNNAGVLSGGDIFGGDLGVSGQTLASSTIRQEIDGTEALRFDLDQAATKVTIDLSRLDGNSSNGHFDAGRLQLLDDAGLVVDELIFNADAFASDQQITLEHGSGFSAAVLTAGVYNGTDFIFGGLSDSTGQYQSDPQNLGNGVWDASEYLVDAVEFEFGEITLVGTAA